MPRHETDPGVYLEHSPGHCPACSWRADSNRDRIRDLEHAVDAEQKYGKKMATRLDILERDQRDIRLARAESAGEKRGRKALWALLGGGGVGAGWGTYELIKLLGGG